MMRWMTRALAFLALLPAMFLGFCRHSPPPASAPVPAFDAAFVQLQPLELAALPLAVRFEAPMGTATGALTYNAQPFLKSRHLGDDLNGIGGWNSDLGDPVYASGAGKVVYTGWPSDGWGNLCMVAHRVRDAASPLGWSPRLAVYAHLDAARAKRGERVSRGDAIGTVGTAGGKYLAHLHFEIRNGHSIYPGPGYSSVPLDRISPESVQKSMGAAGEVRLMQAPERIQTEPATAR